MLNFFRKYQWYFFLVITIVIVISFTFFGTYNTLSTNSWKEQVIFTAVNGEEITRSEVEDMVNFLSTDSDDKALYGGAWGLNFFNDGVISKDFLQTGLAQELVKSYVNELGDELQSRLVKEKKYKLYQHPQAKFLSVENTWNYFLPGMADQLKVLRSSTDALENDAFQSRVNLYLGQKRLSAPMLKQVLRYQESQYDWLTPDAELDNTDLSLFGYHTIEDWFGPRFVRLVSQFIINAAALSEQKGYDVSKAEVMADLVRNTEISFKQNKDNPSLSVATPQEYFNEQLRRLNMDQSAAIRVWRQVMLFRRYFQDVGGSVLTDTLPYKNFTNYAKESVNLELYRLPSVLRLNNEEALQKFEIYLNAVAKRSKNDLLALPTTFLTAAEVNKAYPELVKKRYVVEIARISKKNLQSKVSLKEMWGWEVSDPHWVTLKKQFPELGVKKDSTRDERFAALDQLDSATRSKVDAVAKAAIVESHPEWINKALSNVQPKTELLSIRYEGGNHSIEGLSKKEKRQELMNLLDQAKLGQQPAEDSKLYAYTADGQNVYRITVLKRDAEPSVITFAEASQDGTLGKTRDRLLEAYYSTIREQNPSAYQNPDKSWKDFTAVRTSIAELYGDKILGMNQLLKALQAVKIEGKVESFTKDQAASLRLYPYFSSLKSSIEKDPNVAASFVRTEVVESSDNLPFMEALADQWRIEKVSYPLKREALDPSLNLQEGFDLAVGTWSAVKTPVNGDLVFFRVQEKGDQAGEIAMAEKTRLAHKFLSIEAQRVLMRSVLQQIKDNKAISLSYLNAPVESESPSSETGFTGEF